MFAPFKLRSTLSRNANADPDDTRRTKKALDQIGYFETPSYGMTEYPDEPMFKGIEDFQRDQGLNRDGIMKPNGETAKALEKKVGKQTQRNGVNVPAKPQATKTRSAFGLFGEFGKRRTNQPRDIAAVERALAWTGNLPRNQSKTEGGRKENDLFDAVKRVQQKTGLKVDGWMRPYGETERELDRQLKPKLRDAQKTRGTKTEGSGSDDQQETAAAAIPPIAYKIAEFFGMAVMAAWTWWQSMSSADREKVRRQMDGNGSSDNSEEDCHRLHYETDIPTCNGISRRRGKQAAARCFASASERYAACLRGVPINQLPPLDTWNN